MACIGQSRAKRPRRMPCPWSIVVVSGGSWVLRAERAWAGTRGEAGRFTCTDHALELLRDASCWGLDRQKPVRPTSLHGPGRGEEGEQAQHLRRGGVGPAAPRQRSCMGLNVPAWLLAGSMYYEWIDVRTAARFRFAFADLADPQPETLERLDETSASMCYRRNQSVKTQLPTSSRPEPPIFPNLDRQPSRWKAVGARGDRSRDLRA